MKTKTITIENPSSKLLELFRKLEKRQEKTIILEVLEPIVNKAKENI